MSVRQLHMEPVEWLYYQLSDLEGHFSCLKSL